MLKVRYIGPFGQATGYGRACGDNLLALHQTGQVELDIQLIMDFDRSKLEPQYECLLPFVEQAPDSMSWADVHVVHTIPFGCKRYCEGNLKPADGVKKVAITTWETNRLRPDIALELKTTFDKVIVPCKQNQSAFNNSGISQVAVVPHGFDPARWPWRDRTNKDVYTFGWLGEWSYRKNPVGVILSYLAEFTAADPVRLIIKTNRKDAPEAIRSIKAGMYLDLTPPIEVVTDRLSGPDLIDLHHDIDCYVSLHRGEGFALGAFESVITGANMLYTNFGGPCEFSTAKDQPIKFASTPAWLPEEKILDEISGMPIIRVSRIGPTGIDGKQFWAEPRLDDAMFYLRRMFLDKKRKSAWAREYYETRFSFKAIGAQLLKELCA